MITIITFKPLQKYHIFLNISPSFRAGEGVLKGLIGTTRGPSAIKPGQTCYTDLALSTNRSRITYSLEYFIREQTSSSACPSRTLIRLSLFKVSMCSNTPTLMFDAISNHHSIFGLRNSDGNIQHSSFTLVPPVLLFE